MTLAVRRCVNLLLLSLLTLTGCGGSSSGSSSDGTSIVVTFTNPGTSPPIEAGSTMLSVSVNVAGDKLAQGVTFALSGPGVLSAASGGFFDSPAFNAAYAAPASLAAQTTTTIVATSISDKSKTAALTLTLVPHIVLDTQSVPGGSVASTYNFQFSASQGFGTYTYSKLGGVLPPGLSLSQAGLLSGIPTSSGTYTFTIQVYSQTYSVPGSVVRDFTLVIT